MTPSALKLEYYSLTTVQVRPEVTAEATPPGGLANFDNAVYSSDVAYQEVDQGPDGTPRHTVELTLHAKPADGKAFPYSFDIGVLGLFDARALPEDKRSELVLVNGTSMLYGVLRETLLSLTSRMVQGQVMLPSVHWVDLAQKIAADRAREASLLGQSAAPLAAPDR